MIIDTPNRMNTTHKPNFFLGGCGVETSPTPKRKVVWRLDPVSGKNIRVVLKDDDDDSSTSSSSSAADNGDTNTNNKNAGKNQTQTSSAGAVSSQTKTTPSIYIQTPVANDFLGGCGYGYDRSPPPTRKVVWRDDPVTGKAVRIVLKGDDESDSGGEENEKSSTSQSSPPGCIDATPSSNTSSQTTATAAAPASETYSSKDAPDPSVQQQQSTTTPLSSPTRTRRVLVRKKRIVPKKKQQPSPEETEKAEKLQREIALLEAQLNEARQFTTLKLQQQQQQQQQNQTDLQPPGGAPPVVEASTTPTTRGRVVEQQKAVVGGTTPSSTGAGEEGTTATSGDGEVPLDNKVSKTAPPSLPSSADESSSVSSTSAIEEKELSKEMFSLRPGLVRGSSMDENDDAGDDAADGEDDIKDGIGLSLQMQQSQIPPDPTPVPTKSESGNNINPSEIAHSHGSNHNASAVVPSTNAKNQNDNDDDVDDSRDSSASSDDDSEEPDNSNPSETTPPDSSDFRAYAQFLMQKANSKGDSRTNKKTPTTAANESEEQNSSERADSNSSSGGDCENEHAEGGVDKETGPLSSSLTENNSVAVHEDEVSSPSAIAEVKQLPIDRSASTDAVANRAISAGGDGKAPLHEEERGCGSASSLPDDDAGEPCVTGPSDNAMMTPAETRQTNIEEGQEQQQNKQNLIDGCSIRQGSYDIAEKKISALPPGRDEETVSDAVVEKAHSPVRGKVVAHTSVEALFASMTNTSTEDKSHKPEEECKPITQSETNELLMETQKQGVEAEELLPPSAEEDQQHNEGDGGEVRRSFNYGSENKTYVALGEKPSVPYEAVVSMTSQLPLVDSSMSSQQGEQEEDAIANAYNEEEVVVAAAAAGLHCKIEGSHDSTTFVNDPTNLSSAEVVSGASTGNAQSSNEEEYDKPISPEGFTQQSKPVATHETAVAATTDTLAYNTDDFGGADSGTNMDSTGGLPSTFKSTQDETPEDQHNEEEDEYDDYDSYDSSEESSEDESDEPEDSMKDTTTPPDPSDFRAYAQFLMQKANSTYKEKPPTVSNDSAKQESSECDSDSSSGSESENNDAGNNGDGDIVTPPPNPIQVEQAVDTDASNPLPTSGSESKTVDGASGDKVDSIESKRGWSIGFGLSNSTGNSDSAPCIESKTENEDASGTKVDSKESKTGWSTGFGLSSIRSLGNNLIPGLANSNTAISSSTENMQEKMTVNAATEDEPSPHPFSKDIDPNGSEGKSKHADLGVPFSDNRKEVTPGQEGAIAHTAVVESIHPISKGSNSDSIFVNDRQDGDGTAPTSERHKPVQNKLGSSTAASLQGKLSEKLSEPTSISVNKLVSDITKEKSIPQPLLSNACESSTTVYAAEMIKQKSTPQPSVDLTDGSSDSDSSDDDSDHESELLVSKPASTEKGPDNKPLTTAAHDDDSSDSNSSDDDSDSESESASKPESTEKGSGNKPLTTADHNDDSDIESELVSKATSVEKGSDSKPLTTADDDTDDSSSDSNSSDDDSDSESESESAFKPESTEKGSGNKPLATAGHNDDSCEDHSDSESELVSKPASTEKGSGNRPLRTAEHNDDSSDSDSSDDDSDGESELLVPKPASTEKGPENKPLVATADENNDDSSESDSSDDDSSDSHSESGHTPLTTEERNDSSESDSSDDDDSDSESELESQTNGEEKVKVSASNGKRLQKSGQQQNGLKARVSGKKEHAGYDIDLSFAVLAYLQSHGFDKAAVDMRKVLEKRHPQLEDKIITMGAIRWEPLFNTSGTSHMSSEVEDEEEEEEEEEGKTEVEEQKPAPIRHGGRRPSHVRTRSNEELPVTKAPPRPKMKRSVSFDDNVITTVVPRYTADQKPDCFYDKTDISNFRFEEDRRKMADVDKKAQDQVAMLEAMMAGSLLNMIQK